MINKQHVSIVIPAFNEEDGIKKGLETITGLGLHEKYEVIYIDDGSTDNTSTIIAKYPVKLYKHIVNKGYGAALKTGIRKSKGEKIIILDSDGQHDPVHIQKIIEMLDDFDMVIGERDDESFQVKNRKAGKKMIRIVGEYLVDQKLPDYNSGFRGFSREIIKDMLHLMPNGFSFSTTSTLAFLKEGYTIGTFPIKVNERVGRKSNVKFAKDGSKTMLLMLRIIMLFNPLKIFFPASIISFLLGIAFGLYGYFMFGRFSNTAILLSVLGMFLFFIGLIADQIAMLNRRR